MEVIFQVFFGLLVMLTLNHEGEAAKGGAKSIMRNRKGQQGAAGKDYLVKDMTFNTKLLRKAYWFCLLPLCATERKSINDHFGINLI